MKSVATIPSDLRERADLTVGQVARVLEIRKRRGQLVDRIETAEDKVRQLKAEGEALLAEENRILGKPVPA